MRLTVALVLGLLAWAMLDALRPSPPPIVVAAQAPGAWDFHNASDAHRSDWPLCVTIKPPPLGKPKGVPLYPRISETA